jgi:hypothetical protein
MSDVRATIGNDVNVRGERERAASHLQVIQHNPSKRVVQLEHLVYNATEKATGRSGKVVDEPSDESVGRGGVHIREDAFEEK